MFEWVLTSPVFFGILKNITFMSLCKLWLKFLHFLSIYSSVFLGACRSSQLIFYLNFVSCFESHWYSTFNFYKNNFYLPSFSYFLQSLLFSFMMHVFNYLYKILKLNNKKYFQTILYYERKCIILQKIFSK